MHDQQIVFDGVHLPTTVHQLKHCKLLVALNIDAILAILSTVGPVWIDLLTQFYHVGTFLYPHGQVYVGAPSPGTIEPLKGAIKIQDTTAGIVGHKFNDVSKVPMPVVASIGVNHSIVHGKKGTAEAVPGWLVGSCLQDVLAKTLVKLVEVLELGGQEREVVCCQCNTSPHHSEFCLKVLHHIAQEVIGHVMKLFVINLVLHCRLELVAHGNHQRVHG